jgi:hypothetical protein
MSDQRTHVSRLCGLALLAACLMLAACGGRSTVVMRHPESGVVVRCGTATGEKGQDKCIQDFESQGFQRESS